MSKIIFKYWLGIFKRAWNKAKEEVGVKGVLLDFLLSLLTTLVYHSFISPDKQYNLGEIYVGLTIFLALFALVLFLFITSEPALQDKELRQQIIAKEQRELDITVDDELGLHGGNLIIRNFHKTESIHNLYAILEKFNYYQATLMNGELRRKNHSNPDSKGYLERNLRWITSADMKEQISLGPNEIGTLLLFHTTKRPKVLDFEISNVENDDLVLDNGWRRKGIYEVWIDIFGKVGNEVEFRKKTIYVDIIFIPNERIEIQWVSDKKYSLKDINAAYKELMGISKD